ncbi:nitroreductase [Sporomusaceae bacterium BoRhaA]|uniref:nitroreductase family protein n=1 Tax=Pelorhabdus rhamnosifermentans TaxID=2772457 RepID=UPI001C05F167|nr:nitroreductase family protein [Pelorhabdus rhamnosifermentans]MBU2699984.1 nitroreductase [Pelorhabdus rhamnosifermentans]
METLEAIRQRRSIREFQNEPVPQKAIEEILELAMKAPSGKNRQPWRFVVLQDQKKAEFVNVMANAISLRRQQGLDIGSSKLSLKAIKQAPVVILVFNDFSHSEKDYNHFKLLTDTQSIGAAIQTMILAAQDFGLGTLWICDIFYSEREICSWLNRSDELVAAVAMGYANQSPSPRPRKLWNEVTEWIRGNEDGL